MTYCRRYPCFLESILELLDHDLGSRLKSVSHNPFSRIVGYEVDMGKFPFQELRELVCIFRSISHSGDHDILIEYAFVGLLGISIQGCHEHIDRVGGLHRHDPLASQVIRGMQ